MHSQSSEFQWALRRMKIMVFSETPVKDLPCNLNWEYNYII